MNAVIQHPNTDAGAARPHPDICVILNRSSGKKKDKTLENRLKDAFARHPGRFELRTVQKGGDLAEAARRAVGEGFPVIVAAGGDGTICAVAAHLVNSDSALAVLPLGTFNFFARGLGLPEDVEEAVELAATGRPQAVSVGEVNGQIFLNNASLGIYPAILQQREGTYRRWGRSRLAAHWSVLVTFFRFHQSLWLRVSIDGVPQRKKTPLAFLARSAYQLEQYGLDGGDCIRDGRFALFLAKDSNRWHLLLYAIRLLWGRMVPGRDFDMFCGEDIVIETRRHRRLVARDGERERMRSPFHFRILRESLRVIAPEPRDPG
ncbi:diacylglycerol/lipid kinase family protein [Roseitranquillus sediminis]|uniref:diacylglycerol/lipid kinase family protein n=1 Tax=Roseitranquillus sediminis TaxID=2809051 RepID=UPI001D0CB808|nr:diacylglycerol kinase family protein [Roseitranquillus sediminis]MBM9596246.1 diacylglycerol kinase family lipid kinase [Roseitranquillus sediminis]